MNFGCPFCATNRLAIVLWLSVFVLSAFRLQLAPDTFGWFEILILIYGGGYLFMQALVVIARRKRVYKKKHQPQQQVEAV